MRTWDPWVSSASTGILCYPRSFCLVLHVAGAPWRSRPLPHTCPGPHACCTCPSPHFQPRWFLPGQLSCLPHASAAPRTGPCKTPAGQGASKPGSSWDAWGHWSEVGRSFHEHLIPLYTCGGAAWGLEDRELEGRRPGQKSPKGSALTLWPHTKFIS